MKKDVEKITWEELLFEYFLEKNLKPDTEHSYRKVVRLFDKFLGGDSWPGDVTPRDIQRWRRHMLKDQGRSVNTGITECHISDRSWRLGSRKSGYHRRKIRLMALQCPGHQNRKNAH